MEETGILENPALLSLVLPVFEPGLIFYNLQTRMLSNSEGQRGFMAATMTNKARMQTQLETISRVSRP